jgi:chromosome segregation ATPase
MVRTNLNSSLIIMTLLLLIALSAGLHYHLEAERSILENQFVRLDNYDQDVRSRIDYLQELQKELWLNIQKFNETFATYQTSLTELRTENSLLTGNVEKLNKEVAYLEDETTEQTEEQSMQIISLQNHIYALRAQQDANLNVLSGNLADLENLLQQNESNFTDFISNYGTRKMKKNLNTIETEEATLELTNN